MKRSELKKLIKPLVKECVQETLLNEGLLSNIVSEVAQGMGNQFLVENKEEVVPAMSNENSVQMETMRAQKRRQNKREPSLTNRKTSFFKLLTRTPTVELIFLRVQRLPPYRRVRNMQQRTLWEMSTPATPVLIFQELFL